MKTILVTPGKFKLFYLESSEISLLIKFILDYTVPRLISIYIPLFTGMIQDIFPENEYTNVISDSFKELDCHGI
jgi:hypothetical protein